MIILRAVLAKETLGKICGLNCSCLWLAIVVQEACGARRATRPVDVNAFDRI